MEFTPHNSFEPPSNNHMSSIGIVLVVVLIGALSIVTYLAVNHFLEDEKEVDH